MEYPVFNSCPVERTGRIRKAALRLLLIAVLGSFTEALAPAVAQAQQAAPEPAPAPAPSPAPDTAPDHFKELDGGETCSSPSTQEIILIGLGTAVWAVILFLLLVRLLERRFIQNDRSATLGRHAGISLTIFLSSLGMAAIGYMVTGCFPSDLLLGLGFSLAIWIIHLVYTLVIARGD